MPRARVQRVQAQVEQLVAEQPLAQEPELAR